MQKNYTGRYVNIPILSQEINNLFLSEGWESQVMQLSTPMMQPGMPQAGMQYYDYEIRAMKKGHLHHTEEVIVRVRGYPSEFAIIVEEEHIGPLGRELIDHRLFSNIDRQINDGLFDMPMPLGMQQFTQQPAQQPMPQAPMPAQQPTMQQGIKCPQCGYQNPAGAKFCMSCGTRLF